MSRSVFLEIEINNIFDNIKYCQDLNMAIDAMDDIINKLEKLWIETDEFEILAELVECTNWEQVNEVFQKLRKKIIFYIGSVKPLWSLAKRM